MAVATTNITNKVWKENQHIAYDNTIFGDTPEDAQLFVVNMVDAINKARRMVMHVGTYVVLYVKTTHHEWEVTISNRKDSISNTPDNVFYVTDLDTGRDYHAVLTYMSEDDYKNQLWTIQSS